MDRPAPFPCPKCGRMLPCDGLIVVGDVELPVYACEECIRVTPFMGEPMEGALAFCVDANGRAFDPADPDADLRA